MSQELTEQELTIILEARKKDYEEIGVLMQLSPSQVEEIHQIALSKIRTGTKRDIITETEFLPIPQTFRLEEKKGVKQIGTMKVGSKILEILSKGIYTASWNSLKELVSNSFDADATCVNIIYDENNKKVIIKDNGLGMNYVDFDENFTFIVKSDKRKYEDKTPSGRPLIGKIGIGFIAVSELCDKIIVTSAKKGSDTSFVAHIDFSKITAKEAENKEFYEVSKYELTNYEKTNINDHYTNIELVNLKPNFLDILNNKNIHGFEYETPNISKMEDLVNFIIDNEIKNIKQDLGLYWEFILNLSNVIPIEYLEKGPFIQLKKLKFDFEDKNYNIYLKNNYNKVINIINDIKSKLIKYNFNVYFNGLKLKKPILFPIQEEAKEYGKDMILIPIYNLPENGENNADFLYKGYFYYQRTRIVPTLNRGMLVRIKNVAIGEPSFDFWEHPFSGDSMYFPQTFGEIYIEEGLEDSMNIDRSTFKSTQEYTDFKTNLHIFLRKEVFQIAKTMYSIRRKIKSSNKDAIKQESRDSAVKNNLGNEFEIEEVQQRTNAPVKIDKKNKIIELNTKSEILSGFKKPDRNLLEDVSLALEISIQKSNNISEIIEIFWDTLRDITDYRR